ncbi:DUF2802 domain-containing protein [Aliikangiella maris]|uniref:DUF2802 domain-containing protein n=2 Tax=Aliikangiella maris TaxID=3162458 RepID=A0ABV3MRN3_9GAMM
MFSSLIEILIISGTLIVSAAIAFYIVKLNRKITHLHQSVNRLENEMRAINSGHLGMGREIQRVVQNMANVENRYFDKQQEQHQTSSRSFEQAGLLLSRGASIDEVVEAFDISPAEAELLAIMRNSAPTHSH